MKTGFKILLVDDDPDIIEFLSYNLKNEGYMVYTSDNGTEALSKAEHIKPELIILDIMMPGLDGIEVCRRIKKIPLLNDTIIVFLSAKSDDESFIEGFAAGCDDYIKKPIRPKVLSARIKALLRRYSSENENNSKVKPVNSFLTDDLTVFTENYMIVANEKEYILPAKEFNLLMLLISRPERVFNRSEIYRHLWGVDGPPNDRVIDVYIKKLREKIGEDKIKTVKGVGYKFIDD